MNLRVLLAVGCVALPRVVLATARHRALPTTKIPRIFCVFVRHFTLGTDIGHGVSGQRGPCLKDAAIHQPTRQKQACRKDTWPT